MATVRHVPLFAALALAACAPAVRPGMLSPVGARVTNEVLEADRHTFDAWTHRVAALGAAKPAATPERVYTTARAAAWLGFARDAYAADPRDSTADRALGQTRRLVVALESGDPLPVERMTALPDLPRADLWAALDSLRGNGAAVAAPAALADAELALVRAAYLSSSAPATGVSLVRTAANTERTCDAQLQLMRAEQLLRDLRGGEARVAAAPALVPLPAPSTAFVVRLATEAAPVSVAVAPLADTLPPMQLVVHFAPRSSAITAESRVALDQVIAGLRAHRPARIAFEGYTGKRVGEKFDRALAQRRAAAVHRYLSDARLDVARLTRAGAGPVPGSNGSDGPMMLSLIGADGRSLMLTGVHDLEQTLAPPQEPLATVIPPHTKTVAPDRSPNLPR